MGGVAISGVPGILKRCARSPLEAGVGFSASIMSWTVWAKSAIMKGFSRNGRLTSVKNRRVSYFIVSPVMNRERAVSWGRALCKMRYNPPPLPLNSHSPCYHRRITL
jgi:hypothetical protein